MSEYITNIDDQHEKDEELQWAKILSSGNPALGMILVFVQKFCTSVHEYGPAFEAGVLDDGTLEFYRMRLLKRLDYTLDVIKWNNLSDALPSEIFEEIRGKMMQAASQAELAELVEDVHMAGHAICDAMEEIA